MKRKWNLKTNNYRKQDIKITIASVIQEDAVQLTGWKKNHHRDIITQFVSTNGKEEEKLRYCLI